MLPDPLAESTVAASLREQVPGAVVDGTVSHGEPALEIVPAQIVAACRFLKEQHAFQRLSAMTVVDWFPMEPRFEVVYQLHSLERNDRLRLKCRLSEGEEIDSVYSVWMAADWYEREVFDLFGLNFRNHPNLQRIMMPEGWDGHPLRKDYPVHGHKYDYKDE